MVATVFNLTSASSTVHYFRREGYGRGAGAPVNDDQADYYARKGDEHRKASRWRGSGAAALGLTGHVEPGEFRRVLQGYVPETDIRLGRLRDGEHEHRPGVDITLSAPKSAYLEVQVRRHRVAHSLSDRYRVIGCATALRKKAVAARSGRQRSSRSWAAL